MTDGKQPGAFRRKQREFVRKHGLSLKAYAIAFVAVPPAAIYIALKLEHYGWPFRVAAALLVPVVHGALILGGAALVAEGVGRLRASL